MIEKSAIVLAHGLKAAPKELREWARGWKADVDLHGNSCMQTIDILEVSLSVEFSIGQKDPRSQICRYIESLKGRNSSQPKAHGVLTCIQPEAH